MPEEAMILVMGIIGKVPGYVLERMQQDVHVVAGELIRSINILGNALNEFALRSLEHDHHLDHMIHSWSLELERGVQKGLTMLMEGIRQEFGCQQLVSEGHVVELQGCQRRLETNTVELQECWVKLRFDMMKCCEEVFREIGQGKGTLEDRT